MLFYANLSAMIMILKFFLPNVYQICQIGLVAFNRFFSEKETCVQRSLQENFFFLQC